MRYRWANFPQFFGGFSNIYTAALMKINLQILRYTHTHSNKRFHCVGNLAVVLLVLLWHSAFCNSNFSNWHRIKKGCGLLLFNYSALRKAADANKRHQNSHLHEESLISKWVENLYFGLLIFSACRTCSHGGKWLIQFHKILDSCQLVLPFPAVW